MDGGTLSILVADGIDSNDGLAQSPPKAPVKRDRGPKPQDSTEKGKTATTRLFEGISLYARGPAMAFLTCLLAC